MGWQALLGMAIFAGSYFFTPVGDMVDTAFTALTGADVQELMGIGIAKFFQFVGNGAAEAFERFSQFLPYSDGLPAQVIYAANQVTPFFGVVNMFFPVDTVFYLLTLMLSLQVSLWGLQIALKIYGFARGIDMRTDKLDIMASVPDHVVYGSKGYKENSKNVVEYLNRKK